MNSLTYPTDAIYWKATSSDKYGDYAYAAPKLIKVRWETGTDSQKSEIGEESIPKDRVFLQEEPVIESRIFMVEDISNFMEEDPENEGNMILRLPATPTNARRIVNIKTIANFNLTRHTYTATLD